MSEVSPEVFKNALAKPDNPLKSLKPKQRKFLKEFLKSHNRLEAWKKSHPNCHSDLAAYVSVHNFLKVHPTVVDWLYELAGLSDDDFVQVVREGMQAQKSQFYLGKKYDEPDHYARFKAVDLGLKMRGKGEPGKIGNQLNVQIITNKKDGTVKIVEGETV